RVLMDPFDKKTGYKVPVVEADVVTTSHDHFDHNNIHAVNGNFYHIDQPGTYTYQDIQITGTLTYHDKVQGTRLGNNIVYCFTVDGIRVCHCGDLGHLLTPDQISRIGKVDVLLITICGFCAITPAEAVAVRKQLKPVITIPMHYRTRGAGLFGLFYARVNQFLAATGEPARQLRELSVDSMNLAQHAGIVVLNYN
ncbi:MAG TPA: MBL fold metallo-hydrolase, partial [Anaerolineae bacterium]|nr:MBL fold metallo-hydrolase [Anaerolineae bacterium]